ncbi:MAG: shikimate dehydrogenase [Candidatus Sulfopaludibacter sp.]|nr:shikimate dehydrogenase [Candidatus Sulfopaludibacter sp.]
MPANFKAELVGCFGQPVAENPTGAMQEAAFRALDLNWRYLTIEVPAGRLRDAMAGMRAFGMQGVNLTIPHKVSVLEYLDEIAPDAAIIGAVNTVRRDGDRLIGENTDGKGFLRGVRTDAAVDPRNKRVVLLGAGGAARAIVTELALAGASEVVVVNRSVSRGEQMVAGLASKTKAPIRFEPWHGAYTVPCDTDILVNATSIGLYPDLESKPPVDLRGAHRNMLVCDVVFNPPETRLIQAARERGLPVLDGLAMLVYQGAIGFELWTGRKAPEPAMKQALRDALGLA